MEIDPRTSHDRLLQIRHPARSPKIAGVAPEGSRAVLVTAVKTLFAELSNKNSRTHEIHSSALLDSEKAERLAVHRPAALDAYKTFRRELTRESARIEQAHNDAFPVLRSHQLGPYALMQDQLLGMRLGAMNASEKTRLVAEAMRDPHANVEIIGAVLRLGCHVTGCDPEMVRRLHAESMQAFKPQEVDLLQAQDDLLELAQRGDELARMTLAEEFQIGAAELDAINDPLPDVPASNSNAMSESQKWESFHSLPAEVQRDLTGVNYTPPTARALQ